MEIALDDDDTKDYNIKEMYVYFISRSFGIIIKIY